MNFHFELSIPSVTAKVLAEDSSGRARTLLKIQPSNIEDSRNIIVNGKARLNFSPHPGTMLVLIIVRALPGGTKRYSPCQT